MSTFFDTLIGFWIWFNLNASICLSQTTTSTPSPTTNSFYAVSLMDLGILAGIIIGGPICIALLCWYQKRKTRRLKRACLAKQEILDRKMQNEEYRRNQVKEYNLKMQMQHLQLSNIAKHRSHNSGQPLLSNKSSPDNSLRHKSSPLIPPPPKSSNDSNPASRSSAVAGSSGSSSVPPPPNSTPPQSPDDEDESRNMIRREKTAPVTISKKKKVHFKMRGKGKGENDHNNNSNTLNVNNKGWSKVASLSTDDSAGIHAMIPRESALIIPDADEIMEDAPPSDSPGMKDFDRNTGAPLHIDAKGTEGKEEEEEGDDGDSSSGEALDAPQGDMLEIAQKQLSTQSPPSLQTIFGRKVSKKQDGVIVEEADSDEESLMRMQSEYEVTAQDGKKQSEDAESDNKGHRKTGTVILDL